MDSLRIAETFSSIQGEGIWSGTPSTFIRVSGCNLRCAWCDTPYASWDPEGGLHTVDALVQTAQQHGNRHVVITGGEPMIFEPVESLCAKLSEAGHTVTIETAGTTFREVRCDLMSISPKLANSTPSKESGWSQRHDKARTNLGALRELMTRYVYQLKFVIGDEVDRDVDEIKQLLAQLPPCDRDRVLAMPEGTTVEALQRRQAALVEVCMREGWRLSPRLHIELFGNLRGT